MKELQFSSYIPPQWQQSLDAIFHLSWRKILLALLVLASTGAFTWIVYLPRGGVPGILNQLVFIVGAVFVPLYLLAALAYTLMSTQPPARFMRVSRYTLLLIPAFFVGILLHNALYALFFPYYARQQGDEAILFVVTLLGLPVYFLFVLLNTIRLTLRRS